MTILGAKGGMVGAGFETSFVACPPFDADDGGGEIVLEVSRARLGGCLSEWKNHVEAL